MSNANVTDLTLAGDDALTIDIFDDARNVDILYMTPRARNAAIFDRYTVMTAQVIDTEMEIAGLWVN